MTFTAWLRGRRLGTAYARIQEGSELDDVALGHGFESHSGFREAFARVLVQRAGDKKFTEYPLSPNIPIYPGDLISVPERYF